MSDTDKAASPVLWGDRWSLAHAARLLGVDTETLTRRLLYGSRVETYRVDATRELLADSISGHLVSGEGGVMYMAEALLRQLTRPDNTDGTS